jgi:phosphatidylserine/phosphatidylglycerophosphate/cardiolipin synthase-like enzyme
VKTCRTFPWRYGNRFRLLIDGVEFLEPMAQAIEAAERSVMLEMYLFESGAVADRFIAALVGAGRRGARVMALLDAFGSLGLRHKDRRRLTAAGVELRFHNALGWGKRLSNFMRNHRKLLLIDDRVVFVGGMGLTDDFADRADDRSAWRETAVEIEGPVVADWSRLFLHTWSRRGPCDVPVSPEAATREFDDGAAGRVASSEGWHRAELANSIVGRIDSARRRVWITSPYFVTSHRFRKALRRAVRRGVDVRVLGSGPRTDHPTVRHAARRFFGKLLRNGVRIFEYQPRVLHAKTVICDDWVSIGSSNLDRWGFKWNLEANQEIEHRPFANRAAAVFEADCGESLELDRREWLRRPALDRARENLAGLLDRTLERCRRPLG